MAKKDYELTQAEWEIIASVWQNQPCAAPAIQEALDKKKGWSYSTVKTMMDRMVTKGLLKTERVRNLILYRSAVTRRRAQRSEILRTVKRAFDGAMTPMMQFMLENNKLSKKDLDELGKLINSKKARK
jgi:BlaI family penicillinase repressor